MSAGRGQREDEVTLTPSPTLKTEARRGQGRTELGCAGGNGPTAPPSGRVTPMMLVVNQDADGPGGCTCDGTTPEGPSSGQNEPTQPELLGSHDEQSLA